MRRGYKALKHALEHSAAVPQTSERQSSSRKEAGERRLGEADWAPAPSLRLGREELEAVWEDLASARSASCGTATEKPRLGCLRAFVEAGASAVDPSGEPQYEEEGAARENARKLSVTVARSFKSSVLSCCRQVSVRC